MPTGRLATATAILLLLAVPGALAQTGSAQQLKKADTSVRQALESGTSSLQVIIRASESCRTTIKQSLKAHGDLLVSDQPSIGAMTMTVHANHIAEFDANECVYGISDDAVIATHAGPNGGSGGDSTAVVSMLRETLGLSGTSTGAGVGVAVIDSGLISNTDFNGRLVGFYNFLNGGSTFTLSEDYYGHGTHVAGLIGSSGANSSGLYAGVAPGVRLIGMVALDRNGQGRTSDVINALTYATANKAKLGIDIINLSLGHPVYEPAATDPLVQAVEQAVRAGIVVVASAGNFGVNAQTGEAGYGGISSPGNAPSAITVGALNMNGTVARGDDTVAPYSSRGPTWYDGYAKPDILAPGHRLISNTSRTTNLYKNYTSLRVNSDYLLLSGSSMATAVASGVAALVIEANRAANSYPSGPSLTPNAVKAILQFSAFKMKNAGGLEYDELIQGAGAINAAGAISLAAVINTAAPVGSPWLTGGFNPVTTIAGENLPWAQGIVWGDGVVWGDTITTNWPTWALGVVWGDSDDGVVWGDNDGVVWGDGIVWGDGVVWGDNLLQWGAWGDATSYVWGSLYSAGSVTSNSDVWATVTFE